VLRADDTLELPSLTEGGGPRHISCGPERQCALLPFTLRPEDENKNGTGGWAGNKLIIEVSPAAGGAADVYSVAVHARSAECGVAATATLHTSLVGGGSVIVLAPALLGEDGVIVLAALVPAAAARVELQLRTPTVGSRVEMLGSGLVNSEFDTAGYEVAAPADGGALEAWAGGLPRCL